MRNIIRKASLKDALTIKEIYWEGVLSESKLQFPEVSMKIIKEELVKSEKDLIKYFETSIRKRSNEFYVYETEAEVVGFLEATYLKKQYIRPGVQGIIGLIEKVYVKTNYRKNQIGTKLMKHVLKIMKPKCDIFQSQLYANNKPSMKFHEKFRFKPFGIRMRK